MKKLLSIAICGVLLLSLFTSCQSKSFEYSTDPNFYEPLIFSAGRPLEGVTVELDINTENPLESEINRTYSTTETITVKYNGEKYECKSSQYRVEYHTEMEYDFAIIYVYAEKDGTNYKFGITHEDHEVKEFYTSIKTPGVESKDDIDREKCLRAAKRFLRKHVKDFSLYKIENEYLTEYAGVDGYHGYTFEFKRDLGDFAHYDRGTVSVGLDGKILGFNITRFGQLEGLTSAPDETVMTIINGKVQEKWNKVYEPLKGEYDFEYEISTTDLFRYHDGRLALKYGGSIVLHPKDNPENWKRVTVSPIIVFLE